jgi:hypothetical protein
MAVDPSKKRQTNQILSQLGGEKRRRIRKATDLLGGSSEDLILEYTTPGTYTDIARPDPVVYPNCEVLIIGGGGGGGSGRRGLATENCRGGTGAANGSLILTTLPTGQISSPFSVTVGAGGAGGAAQTVDSTDGVNGTNGGASTVSLAPGQPLQNDLVTALGGFGGGQGTVAGGGNPVGRVCFFSGVSVTAAAGGVNTVAGNGGSATSNNGIPISGGAGATLAANNTNTFVGGDSSFFSQTLISTGGTGLTPNGENGKISEAFNFVATGGGGGAAIDASSGGSGGNGIRGSGGGGGSGSRDGFNSGAGGNGGDGYVRLRFHA